MDPKRALKRQLEDAQGVLRFSAAVDVALGAAAFGAVGLGVALILVGALPFSMGLRSGLWLLIGASALGGGIWRWRVAWQPAQHDTFTASRLEEAAARQGAQLGDRVRSAASLLDDHDDAGLGRSRALADRHIADTVAALDRASPRGALATLAARDRLPVLIASAVVGAVFAVTTLVASDALDARWARLFDAAVAREAAAAEAATRLPLVTDLQLSLRYPAHTGLGVEKALGSSGDVRAPRGTEVTVTGRADRAITGAVILVGEQEVAASVDGRTLTGTFVVDVEGSYRFRLVEPDGDEELDPVAHRVSLIPDESPTLEVEVPGLEAEDGAEGPVVRLEDEVGFTYRVRDDHGVSRVRLVARRQGATGDPKTWELATLDVTPRQFAGSGTLNIKEAGARPGDRLSVWVEAEDNDTISGPKVGRSSTIVLVVFSAREQHRRLIELQERLLERMVHSLADELEAPLDGEPPADPPKVLTKHAEIGERRAETLKILDEVLAALAKDTLSPESVRRALVNMRQEVGRPHREKKNYLANASRTLAAGRKLLPWTWGQMARTQKVLVQRLETHTLYLEDLLNQQRLAEVRELAEEMRRTQQDLKELLDQYQKSQDDKVREALLDEIQRLREQMQDLMKRMAALQKDIPDEYLNEEAFQTDEMMEDAQSLEELIEQGKLDEAAKRLQQMAEQTQKMLDDMDKKSEEFGGDEYAELREKMREFSEELEAVEAEQEELLHRTERMLEAARQEAERRLGGKLKKKLEALRKKARDANKIMQEVDTSRMFSNEQEDAEIAKARAEAIDAALEMQDLEEALEAAAEAASAARGAERSLRERTGMFGSRDPSLKDAKKRVSEARPMLEELEEELLELLPEPSRMLSEPQRQAMRRDAEQQRKLSERAQRLVQKMNEVNEELPIFGPQHSESMKDSAQQMRRGGRSLERLMPRPGRSQQQRALDGIKGIRESLQQSGQQSGGGGIPMPLPGGGQQPGQEGENGRQNPDEKVKIPGADEFRVPDAFRKDILDAMREGAPEDWENEVKRYYEGLVK
jgi:hypothetical protein